MEVVPVLVAYHSVHWIRVAVESYLRQFPEDRLLVVDNNPKRGEAGWLPDCEQERQWLSTHPDVILVDNDTPPDGILKNRTHGAGLDLALEWCRRYDKKVLVHLEPDCLVTGRQWRDNLLRALDQGAWMAGSVRQCHGPIHPTPSAWLVQEVRASFKIAPWKGRDDTHPRFKDLIDPAALQNDSSPMGIWIGWTCYWDTGHKAWFEAAVQDRAALVDAPMITHFWHGSHARRCSERALLARHPELLPYLEQARARVKPLSVEQCKYRYRVHVEAGVEVACCRILQEASGVENGMLCMVRREACRACCATFSASADQLNPVIASLLFVLAEQVVKQGGVSGCSAEKADRIRNWAESELDCELS